MADFFSDPNEWTDEGAVRLDFHHKRRVRGERDSACYSLPTGLNRFPPLSNDRTNPLSFIWLSGFARVGGKDEQGDYPPCSADEQEGPGGERKAENRLYWSPGERDLKNI